MEDDPYQGIGQSVDEYEGVGTPVADPYEAIGKPVAEPDPYEKIGTPVEDAEYPGEPAAPIDPVQAGQSMAMAGARNAPAAVDLGRTAPEVATFALSSLDEGDRIIKRLGLAKASPQEFQKIVAAVPEAGDTPQLAVARNVSAPPPEAEGPVKAALREASREAGPALAALKVGGATAGAMAPSGPWALLGGLAAGMLTYAGASKAQDLAIDSLLGPDRAEELNRQLAMNRASRPVATLVGQLAPQALAFRPSIQNLRRATSFSRQLLAGDVEAALKAPGGGDELANLINVSLGAGTAAAVEAYAQLNEGNFQPVRLMANIALGATLTEPTKLARMTGMVPGELPDLGTSKARNIQGLEASALPYLADPARFPIVEMPVEQIRLSKDVQNFKAEADATTGVVPGQELQGKYERLGTGPIVVWQRADGALEVITGRHRLDLARRTGEKTIPAQVVKETAGFSRQMALRFDAESNIRDGNGAVSDYAHFFRNSDVTPAEARARGLLARVRGRAGWALGKMASEDLYALYRKPSGGIPEAKAVAIAEAAPNNPDLQRVGMKAALEGASGPDIVGRMEAAEVALRSEQAAGRPAQGDFFANTALESAWSAQGKYVAEQRQRLNDVIQTRRAVLNRFDAATDTGSIRAKRTKAQEELDLATAEMDRWSRWGTNAELRGEVTSLGAQKARPIVSGSDAAFPEWRRRLAEESGGEAARRFDAVQEDAGTEAAVRFAKETLGELDAIRRDLGDGVVATRNGRGEWELDANGERVRLSRDNDQHRSILRRLEPEAHHQAVREEAAAVAKDLKGVAVEVVRDVAELPEGMTLFSRADGSQVEGVYTGNGKVYVVSSAVPLERVQAVIAHEAVGHAGLRGLLGQRLNGVLDQVYNGRPAAQLRDVAGRYGLDLSTEAGRLTAAEELLARMAENRDLNPGLWQRTVAAIRQVLRDMGFVRRFSDNDVVALLGRAREYIERSAGTMAEAPRFSVSEPGGTDDVLALAKQAIAAEQQKMRGFAQRVADSDFVTPAQKATIETEPGFKYVPQSLDEINARLESLKPDELVLAMDKPVGPAVSSEDNFAVLAGIKLLNDTVAAGGDALPIVEKLAKMGTSVGQLLRQFAELKTKVPEGLLAIIEKKVGKAGRALTDGQKTKLLETIKADFDARDRLRAAERIHKNVFSDVSAEAVGKALTEAEAASRKLLNAGRDVLPQDWADMIVTMIQGNLLTPLSQLANVSGNLLFTPLRYSEQAIAAGLDALDNLLTRRGRTVLSPFTGTREGLRGAGSGVARAATDLVRGPNTEQYGGELIKGFRPLRAFAQFFTGDMMPVGKDGKVPAADRLKKFVEATLGIAPETSLRFLQFGDLPVRTGSTARGMAEQAALRGMAEKQAAERGLQGEAADKFVRSRTQHAADIVGREAAEAVYQQENMVANWVSQGFKLVGEVPVIGPYLRVASRLVVPYVKTPTNLAMEGLHYAVPEFSLAKAGWYFSKGDRRQGYLHVGKAVTGFALKLGARWLVEKGLASGDPDKVDKMRNVQFATLAPNSVNLSGLRRAMAGEDGSWREGDEIHNYTKLGFFGLVLQMEANRSEREWTEATAEGRYPDEGGLAAFSTLSAMPELAAATLNMTALKGTASLLDAVQARKYDSWFGQMSEAVASIALPNTLAAVNRARQVYVPEMASDSKWDRFTNTVKGRLMMTDDLPVKRDLFGRAIKRTPEGANPWVYQFLNITKAHEIPKDPLLRAAYDTYAATGDADALPAIPDRKLMVNKQERELTRPQYDRYTELVGKMRAMAAAQVVYSPGWESLPAPAQLARLRKAYSAGGEVGKAIFLYEERDPSTIQRLSPRVRDWIRWEGQ